VTDGTIRGDISHLEQLRAWFERPLWEMQPADADAYFGRVLRGAPSGTRLARSQALRTYFEFLELRHKVELHQLTGRVVACPIDELNRPRGSKDARLRIPPRAEELAEFFAGWAAELATCRKFAPSARNYTAAKLMATVGLRVNEARNLDLADIKWELGPFGKLHVRCGKGARGSGPRERMVPWSTTPTGRCAGSSRTSGASSTTTTPATARRCCPPSGPTLTGRAGGSATTPCALGWPPRPPTTCPGGRAG
jgi:integrase/recombinase XerD